jgi:hypothetical protein
MSTQRSGLSSDTGITQRQTAENLSIGQVIPGYQPQQKGLSSSPEVRTLGIPQFQEKETGILEI